MAGGGPDGYLLSSPTSNMTFNGEGHPATLFPDVQRTMQVGAFLPLDDYIKESEYLRSEDHFAPVFDTGKTDEGQVVLPITYYASVFLLDKAQLADPDFTPKTWDELKDLCAKIKQIDPDSIPLGSYRGFQMTLCFDSFEKLFKISMQGTLTYKVGLGTDVFGNIQRMDNLLESMPTRQLDYKEKLKNLEIQVENAKQEIAKPFPREDELKEKSARLDQLNILLNMDKRENEIVDGVQDEGEIQPQRESRGWDR